MYHVAPRSCRESINRHGLQPSQFYDAERPSPWLPPETAPGRPSWASADWRGWPQRMQVFAIETQPEATYLAPSLQEAHRYLHHVQERFGTYRSWDIWEVRLPAGTELHPDQDWPGEAQYTRQPIPAQHLKLIR